MTPLLALLLAQATIDAPVDDFSLRDLRRGGTAAVALSSFRGKKAVVLVFTSAACDACTEYEERRSRIVKDFAGRDVQFLAVRSSAEDTAESMRAYAEKHGYAFPVLDDAGSRMARYFRVIVTPTFVVIDREAVMRFRGPLDDALVAERATKAYLKDALEAVLAGRPVPAKDVRAVGCHLPREEGNSGSSGGVKGSK